MPYQALLDGLVREADGVSAALLLDSEGEVAFEAGDRDERHRLIGAYQGILLALARRAGARHGLGAPRYIACRYQNALLLVRPLKDGYYLLASLDPHASVAGIVHASESVSRQMADEL